FTRPNPSGGESFTADLNPNSLEILPAARLEPALADAQMEKPVQFERQGYFTLDRDSKPGKPVFSRTIRLRHTVAKGKTTGQGAPLALQPAGELRLSRL